MNKESDKRVRLYWCLGSAVIVVGIASSIFSMKNTEDGEKGNLDAIGREVVVTTGSQQAGSKAEVKSRIRRSDVEKMNSTEVTLDDPGNSSFINSTNSEIEGSRSLAEKQAHDQWKNALEDMSILQQEGRWDDVEGVVEANLPSLVAFAGDEGAEDYLARRARMCQRARDYNREDIAWETLLKFYPDGQFAGEAYFSRGVCGKRLSRDEVETTSFFENTLEKSADSQWGFRALAELSQVYENWELPKETCETYLRLVEHPWANEYGKTGRILKNAIRISRRYENDTEADVVPILNGIVNNFPQTDTATEAALLLNEITALQS